MKKKFTKYNYLGVDDAISASAMTAVRRPKKGKGKAATVKRKRMELMKELKLKN